MEKSTHHITEFRQNQDIDYSGITSFKVLNNGEATVDINDVAVYPGKTLKIIEEDGTYCNFNLKAIFTEAAKMPKFKAIYKQLDSQAGITDNAPVDLVFATTLYNYTQGDIVEYSQNVSGETVLMRSFDGGNTYDELNTIALGYIIANVKNTYDNGGSNETTNIKFKNLDTNEFSEDFSTTPAPFDAKITEYLYYDFLMDIDRDTIKIIPNKSGSIDLQYSWDGIFGYPSIPLGNLNAGQEYTFNGILPYRAPIAQFRFFNVDTQELSKVHEIYYGSTL